MLVIGNELLTGKVCEANLVVLAKSLRKLGILLRRVVMVRDDVDTIAREVRELSGTHDWLFTSGGVGPTHDDVTIEAVAQAFGVSVVMSPEMKGMLEAHYRERLTPGHLRMALIPEGGVLETTSQVPWPTVRVANTWIMPGVPQVFEMKIQVIEAKIGADRAFVSHAVYTKMDEGDLKPLLDRIVLAFPNIEVGSYPKWSDPTYQTKLTFDGLDPALVAQARDAFIASLPPGEPQHVE
jgi:molybdenum cofactor synthesis domain-containing protein